MSVLLPDRSLGVRRRLPGGVDAHGDRVAAGWGPLVGPWPGRASEGADAAEMYGAGGRTWVLAVDPAGWPLGQGDLVVDPGSRQEWLVTSADLAVNNADPAIDYIRVEAHLHAGAGTAP